MCDVANFCISSDAYHLDKSFYLSLPVIRINTKMRPDSVEIEVPTEFSWRTNDKQYSNIFYLCNACWTFNALQFKLNTLRYRNVV